MNAYHKKCLEICNDVLAFLRSSPDGRFDSRYNYSTCKWHIDGVKRSVLHDRTIQFEDVLAILKDDEYIEYNKYELSITDKGRVFILTNGYKSYDDVDVIVTESGLVIPKIANIGYETPLLPDIVLHPYWKHGKNKLLQLSKELYAQSFLENENDFVSVFTSGGVAMCNWSGTHLSLLYLLRLSITKNTSTIPAFIVGLAHERFLINRVHKKLKDVQTAASKVKPFLSAKESEVTGRYLTIYEIFEKSMQ